MERGEHVGNYEIVSLLGAGGFAEVYRVRHRMLGSDHALKVLHDELLRLEEVRQRFLDEARVQARLHHPGIVRVTDLIAEPGLAGFIMEFVDGRSLAAEIDLRVASRSKPSAAKVREVFLPVLAAVGYAHAHQVVHRDLKPENILLPKDHAGVLTPKVADFGIAKIAGELRGERRSTVGARTLGTLGYMSPEQVVSSRDVDVRSDIFSLGVCLLEYATLVSPFDRDSEFQTMKAIHEVDYVIPDELRSADPGLVAVVERALEKEPGRRFASAAEMAHALGDREVAGAGHGNRLREAPRSNPRPEPAPVPQPSPAPRSALSPARPAPAPAAPASSVPAVFTATRPAPVEVVHTTRVEVVQAPPAEPEKSSSWRVLRGCLGAVAGFLFGAPLGGLGAIPGAIFGFLVGAYLPEVIGCGFLVAGSAVLVAVFANGC